MMKILIITDMFSLESWIIDEKEPKNMPAVYEWFRYLGNHPDHRFHAILCHPWKEKTMSFPNGSTVELIPMKVASYYLRKFCSIIKLFRKAETMLKIGTYDVVYGMGIYSTLAFRLGKKYNLCSVSRIFGSSIYDLISKRKYLRLYTRNILQYLEIRYASNLVICTEDGTQFDCAARSLNPGMNLKMLYNGVERQLRNRLKAIPIPNIKPGQPVRLLSAGRLVHWKRHDLAIQFFQLLKEKYHHHQWTLTLLGQGRLMDQLQSKVREIGLADDIRFMGTIEHQQIPELLAGHQIFLSFYDLSNLSNLMWEAALSGRLICTRPTGKTPQVFRNMENALVSNDLEVLADSLMDLKTIEIDRICRSARASVDQLIPDWRERFAHEMELIAHGINSFAKRNSQ